MHPLTERDAERHLAARALTTAHPGFVGLAVDLPPTTSAPAGRSPLRHGFLRAEAGRVTISGPPSPGLEVAVARMAEDLDRAATLTSPATVRGVRVSLEAGTDDHGPTGIRRRWAVAQAIAPVLAAAFATSPMPDGSRASRHSAPRPAPATTAHRPDACTVALTGPAGSGADPRVLWARQVLDTPVSALAPATFRDWIRHGRGRRPELADLERHERAYRPPVAARGHLEIDVTDRLPDDGWLVAAAVISALVEDAQAATEAMAATGRRSGPLTDPVVAAAARSLFLSAYGALARRGAPRPMRDAVAAYLERYVMRGRCPADDEPTRENQP